jgi:hypothetical protein
VDLDSEGDVPVRIAVSGMVRLKRVREKPQGQKAALSYRDRRLR